MLMLGSRDEQKDTLPPQDASHQPASRTVITVVQRAVFKAEEAERKERRARKQ